MVANPGPIHALRAEFVRLLTEDGPTSDRRRSDYNQAIFLVSGHAIWCETDLDMVLDKFDRARRNILRDRLLRNHARSGGAA